MSRKSGVRALIVFIGFSAAVAQIVLLRELLVVFCGNESSIGLMLASWLLWTAVGSWLGGVSGRAVAAIQVLLAAVLPGTILAVRAAHGVLQAVPGETLGPGSMLLTSLVALAPLCVLSGALFPAAGRMYARAAGDSPGAAMGAVYLWEAIGFSAGGLVAAVAMVRIFGPLESALLLAACNLASACAIAIPPRSARYTAMAVVAAAAILLELSGASRRVEEASQKRFWRGQPLIATRNSVYGSLAVVGTSASRTLYENGVVLFTVPDPAAAEEAVHYALLEHPAPRNLLLIGGGLNGSIAEAFRHPTLERVDYVELDPAILDLAREYFPRQWQALRQDSRVHVHIADGRLFVKQSPLAFDVAIVNLPDPRNAQLNRFYTADFFAEVAQKLTERGVFSFQLKASENYISPELGQFLGVIDASLRAVYPAVYAIPGETVHFFAARRAGTLVRGDSEVLARLHARRLETNYVSEYLIPYRLTPDRVADLESHLQSAPTAPLNRDFQPIAYYLDVALWSSQFHPRSGRLFRALAAIPFASFLAVLAVLAAAMLLAAQWVRNPGQRRRLAAASCTAATGFNMIGIEMLLLLGFQAKYGYVYQQLALLIAAFMAGMSLGSWLSLRRSTPPRMLHLGVTQLLIAAAPLVLAGLFAVMPASAAAFTGAALACGTLGGFEFPLACDVFFAASEPSRRHRLGALYALDLAGSSLGAMLFAAWLFPVFGFLKSAALAAVLSLAPAAMALCGGRGFDPAARPHPATCVPRTPAP